MSDEIWDKAIETARNQWCTGELQTNGNYCALGALARARWGDEFDFQDGERDPYKAIVDDEIIGPMVKTLADVIREQFPNDEEREWVSYDDGVVIEYNDELAETGENLARMMEKAKNR